MGGGPAIEEGRASRAAETTREANAASLSAETSPTPRSRPAASVLPLPIALATLVLTYWCVDVVAPALPDLQDDLALSGTGAGLVFAVFFAGRLVTNLPAALLVDRVGPRSTAAVGAALLGAGSVLAAVAAGEAALLPARGLQGAGVALLVTAGLLSTLRARPAGGAAMTAFNLSASGGGSAGLISGGALTSAFGWPAVFWLSAGLGLALLIGALTARSVAAAPRSSAGPAATGADDVPQISRGALLAALAANLLVFANYSVWAVSLPLYAAERFDASAGGIGALLLATNAVHLGGAVPAGVVIRRVGAARALVGAFVVSLVGMALIPLAPSAWWLVAPLAIYAVGQVAGSSAAGDLLLRLGGGGGRAVGMVRLTSDVGLVAGPAAVGVLADVAGVAAPFPVLAALTLVAAVAAARHVAFRRHR